MADSTAPQTSGAPAGTPSRGPYRGGGRGGGGEGGSYRGGRHRNSLSGGMPNERGEDRSRGDFGGRGRGRGRAGSRGGRGGRGGRPQSQSFATAPPGEHDPANIQPPPQPGGDGVFDNRLIKDAQNNNISGEKKQGTKATADGDGDGEAEVCFICASDISHYSVAPCNHRTCHICSLRLRALYKTKACAHCRTEAATVVFTDEAEKRYEEYSEKDFHRTDPNLGINYEKQEIFEDTVLLLRYNCPDESCDTACMGWPDLHRHVRSVHQKVMCDLCTRNKKVFTHEHELFTQQALRNHEKYGDDDPGASGFKGHPECGFCRQRFYGDDELYAHCRDKHERCHVCDQRDGGNNPQYYVNYEALDQHFIRDHFPCPDQECQEKKFVVFASAMDLKAHQLESHPNGMTKGRDARRVDLSNFDYRPQYQEPRRGTDRGGRRGGGRGRDPNTEPMHAPSGAHQSRAELAYQREREIQSAQTVSGRTFGGRLTHAEPPTQSARQATQSSRHNPTQPHHPALQNEAPTASAPASPRPAEALTPQEQARRLRHAAVTERAANLLRNDQLKLTEFRNHISSYRGGTVKSGDLIDAFFALFDTSSAELGKLIKELADIFEIPGKRDDLLKAWSDWKAINEDYPTLPGPAGANAVTAAGVLGQGVGASRVLKLKSSTAQSNRSVNAAPRTWNSAAGAPQGAGRAAGPTSAAYPSLPAGGKNGGSAPTAGWLALRPATQVSSTASSARVSPAPSRTQSSANLGRGGGDLFPALPAASKPMSSVFSPGYTGSGVIRSNGGNQRSGSAWGAGGGGNTQAASTAAEEDSAGGKGKGKKGKKQIVFAWG
ncbi:hypothetical protein LTR02_000872 [Friedmanniomyces endolithicus]|nr:hypothetical protein LTR59_001648 [Friedmanniomyces endolithicus]KAK0819247.1 hypothetical protein LTR38_000690 [Friedmanniomyces endolithicus]KAK0821769.1 hypothetical protein LTR75_000426 [Friedmanniomyces endolithicus]KAK0852492.1 hypothetical protein LTR03_003470 [Friedmanniomyces endolithicus]KAK0916325.1 hypothetical protein LTR02_000872 [Friedmanniomyces endolithicus]